MKSTLNNHWKDCCWSWSSNTLATWHKEWTRWKRSWNWERLKVKGEEGGTEWDGWIAAPTERRGIWANSRRPWRAEEPEVLQSTRSQRIGNNLETEQQNAIYQEEPWFLLWYLGETYLDCSHHLWTFFSLFWKNRTGDKSEKVHRKVIMLTLSISSCGYEDQIKS